MQCEKVFTRSEPVIPRRGVHLDLKGLPPTPGRLVELLRLFAALRFDFVLVEWEDSFPWTVDERFRSPTAYTPGDIARFRDEAARLGLEIIPLVQCLGHMETPLSVPGYERLRELPDNESGLNPLAPGARELIQSMVDDVLKLLPDVRRFHLGGDEARTFGKSPECQAFIEQHGKGALYLHHVEPMLDELNRRGIRPILWHDMMNDWSSEALHALAPKCDLMPWGYGGHPDHTTHHYNTKYIKRFSEHGFALWGGTAYKGASGPDSDLPSFSLHTKNAMGWTEVAQRFGFIGIVATAWSRYSVDNLQCEPIDSSLDSLVNVAVILHDGQPPEGGEAAYAEALEECGERERFEACKKAIQRLAELRSKGWQHVQKARQVAVLARMDARRVSSRNLKLGLLPLTELEGLVAGADEVAAEVRRAFDGLVEPVWIEEYLETRLVPLREELADLKKRLPQNDNNK